MAGAPYDIERVRTLLEEVKDPEIPVLSLVDLGVVSDITIDNNTVRIELTPTFVGCPALEMMKTDIEEVLKSNGIEAVHISVSYKKPWTSDMITEKGKAAIKKFGIAPPPSAMIIEDLDFLERATCPRCDGQDTELKSAFGATLCRSIFYCHHCKESFEQFKPI